MLQCERCYQRFDEYYYMSDGRILCKDCWRDELNLEEMRALQGRQQRIQVLRDKDAFSQKRKADQVKLEQLEHAIKLEKGKYHSAWSSWDDGYRTDKPYNYEEVELLKRQHLDLSRQLNQNQWFKFPSTPPFSDNTAYYKTAQFISKSQSHYFETVTLPAEQEAKRKAEEECRRAELEAERKRIAEEQERKKKAEEERLQKERERIAVAKKAEEARKQKEAELRPYEEDILNGNMTSREYRLKIAKETFREEVMLKCVHDPSASVVEALQCNPNITNAVRNAIKEKEELAKQRKEIIKTTIYWIIGLAIAGGLIWLIVEYWEAILAILLIIFLLVLFLK